MDDIDYIEKQEKNLDRHEVLCKRCGFCCGASGEDPCSNLEKDDSGKYYCKTYNTRFGVQTTISGKTFNCVPIRDVLKRSFIYNDCGYINTVRLF